MSEAFTITNAFMKEVLTDAIVERGTLRVPLEQVTQPGIWSIDSATPASDLTPLRSKIPYAAVLEVIPRGNSDLIQRITFIADSVPIIVSRIWRLGEWQPWYKFTPTLL